MKIHHLLLPLVTAVSMCASLPLAAQSFDFTRVDTTVVLQNSDTLNYAWAGGMNYCQYSKVDMDMDGLKDLLIFDRTGDMLLTFKYNGGPGLDYTYKPELANYFPAGINSWILMRDYNCDGKEDIFTYVPGGIRVFKNISDTILKFELETPLLKSSQLGNYLNILITSVDIPAIGDIDGDNDLDIIHFGQFGKLIEYDKNYSVEYGYGCDSLPFILKNECWGNFYESSSNCGITLFDTCAVNPFLAGPPEFTPTPSEYRQWFSSEAIGADQINEGSSRHTGSSLLTLDLNGTNTKDLLVGDVSCTHLIALTNGGTVPNTNSSMISQDPTFPSYSVPVNMEIFPAAYHVDMDNDGIRDLVVSPNYTDKANNYDGNWFYKNTGTDLTPVFTFDQSAFFQNEMIENGEGSTPVFFDYNGDGLKDVVVANFGIYDKVNYPWGRHVSMFRLYENTGAANKPQYTLIDTNYAPIVFSAVDTSGLIPTFGDLDADGDEDMIAGDSAGNLHFFINTAGAGNPAAFSVGQINMTDFGGSVIDVGVFATPHLVDIDRDNDLDLLIGERSGNVNYMRNDGSTTSHLFKSITSNFGGVNVCEWWSNIGHSVPYTFDYNGEYHLFVGSLKGKVFHYDNIDNNLTGNFTLLDSLPVTAEYFGTMATPAVADIDGDTYPDMLVGNYRGGLVMYASNGLDTLDAIDELQQTHFLQVFPNPASNEVQLKTDMPGKKHLQFFTADGRLITEHSFSTLQTSVAIGSFPEGVYIIRLQSAERGASVKTVKLVKY